MKQSVCCLMREYAITTECVTTWETAISSVCSIFNSTAVPVKLPVLRSSSVWHTATQHAHLSVTIVDCAVLQTQYSTRQSKGGHMMLNYQHRAWTQHRVWTQHSTAQHSAAQHSATSTAQHSATSTAQHSMRNTAQHRQNTAQHGTAQLSILTCGQSGL